MNTSLVEFSPGYLPDLGLTRKSKIITVNDSRNRYLGILVIVSLQTGTYSRYYYDLKGLLITKDESNVSRVVIIDGEAMVAKRIKRIL